MFCALENNGYIKKRSYTVQGLDFRKCFWCLLCALCSGQSSAEFLLACSAECLDLVHCVVSFNLVCFGLLVNRDYILVPLELKLCSTFRSVDQMVGVEWFLLVF